jgi:hypothetical protein
VVSDADAERQAGVLVQLSDTHQGFNRYRSMLRLLKAQRVSNIEEVYPAPTMQGPDGKSQPAADFPPPPNPKLMALQLKQSEFELKKNEFMAEQQQAKAEALQEANESMARIMKMQAETAKLLAEAKGAETEPVIKMLFASIEAEGKHKDRMLAFAEMISKRMESANVAGRSGGDSGNAGMGGMAGSPANAGVPAMARTNGQGAPGSVGQPGV